MAETENVLLILAVLNMSNVPVDRTDEVLENPTVEQPENVEAQPETAVEESHEVPQTEEAVVEPVAETEVADTDPVPAEEPVADAEPEPSQEPEVGAEEAEPVKDESAPAEDAEEDGLPAPVEEEIGIGNTLRKFPAGYVTDTCIYRVQKRRNDHPHGTSLLQISVYTSHEIVDNRRGRNNNMGQNILYVPCRSTHCRSKHKAEHSAGQCDRDCAGKLDDVP